MSFGVFRSDPGRVRCYHLPRDRFVPSKPAGLQTFTAAETVTLTEALTKLVGVVRGETIGLTEALTATRTVVTSFAETIGLTEVLTATKVVLANLAESVSLTENLIKHVQRPIAETLVLTEGFVKQVNLALAETIAFSEVRLLSVGKMLAEAVGLTESVQASKVRLRSDAETVSLTETLTATTITQGPDLGGGQPPHIWTAYDYRWHRVQRRRLRQQARRWARTLPRR